MFKCLPFLGTCKSFSTSAYEAEHFFFNFRNDYFTVNVERLKAPLAGGANTPAGGQNGT